MTKGTTAGAGLLGTLAIVGLIALAGLTNTVATTAPAEPTVVASSVYDLNGDGCVDTADYSVLSASFGCALGDTCYNLAADLNGDGVVSGADFNELHAHMGEGCLSDQ